MKNITLGRKINTMRVLRGFSQAELAEITTIDRTLISYYENDKAMPTPENLQRLQEVLQTDFDKWQIEGDTVVISNSIRLALAV